MKPALLITVRDIAGAAHLAEVIRALEVDGRLSFRVAAQRPASDFLSGLGIAHQLIELPPAKEKGTEAAADLLAAASHLLASERTDAVLAGLSTPFDGGIDEAVLAEAKVPTFLLQDFWGEQNTFFGHGADVFFVLDETAKLRNSARFGVESIIVGSARHSAYAKRDFIHIRQDKRRSLNIAENAPVIGYFGQALQRMPGYHRTVRSFLDAVEGMKGDVTLLLRMHPRETSDHFNSTMQLFANRRLKPVIANGGTVDDCLAACDVVCSLFSNCTYDASFQNFYAREPLSVPVSMLFDAEIVEYCRERVELEALPIHANKLVVPVYEKEKLGEVLDMCLDPDFRREVWMRAKTQLADPSNSCRLIISGILERVSPARAV